MRQSRDHSRRGVATSRHAAALPATERPDETARRMLAAGQTTIRAVAVRWYGGDVVAAYQAIYQRERRPL